MKKTELKIHIYGEDVLRNKARKVKVVDDTIREVLDQMLVLMHESNGVGLAANQVGLLDRLIVIDVGKGPLKLVNPRIVEKTGSLVLEEGCLSLPGVTVKVKRAEEVVLEALDQDGKKIKVKGKGLLAVCLQHEMDHLDGVLLVDYLPLVSRVRAKQRLKKVYKNGSMSE